MSFKKLFNSSSSSLNNNNVNHTHPEDVKSTTSSHRSFLKQKNSNSLSPISTSSAGNQKRSLNHTAQSNSNHHPMSSTPLQNNTSVNSINSTNTNSSNHSHLSLKRFFKKFKHEQSSSSKSKSTSNSTQIDKSSRDEFPTSAINLFIKYGKPGRLLGTGASGSVNLIINDNNEPNILYAVKKFRSRMPNEQESDYKTKVQNEYKVGEYLSHQNIIHTFELIKDYTKVNKYIADPDYFIIMEYCPFDFFNLVMSGLMEQCEIYCYFKQIVNGVNFLHENGLAHRDLKLDNCVVSNKGILKLIDFGSAVQFRKEVPNGYFVTSNDIMLGPSHKLITARGVVGSDPYLSPEVFEPMGIGYDPRGADVWSIAIIYCCMILKRFPWKIPKLSDPSYRSFAGPQLNGQSQNNHDQDDRHSHHPPIGPDRLLKLLPVESRNLIKSMLILDSKQRILMHEIVQDPFVASIEECRIEDHLSEEEITINSKTHSHHLINEDELKRITQERDRLKKLKDAGVV